MKGIYTLLSSKQFTVFNFAFLAINIIILKPFKINTLAFVSIALFFLCINLIFCFIDHKGFTRKTMTIFHTILLLFIITSAYSSLYFFYGYIELSEGQTEKKGYQRHIQGILHNNILDNISIYQDKIKAVYQDDYNTEIKSLIRIYKKKITPKNLLMKKKKKSTQWLARLNPSNGKGTAITCIETGDIARSLFIQKTA